MTGKLKTYAGPMYAGKTSALLQEILWLKYSGHKILVIKPSIDNRYSATKIETHNGLSIDCFTMSEWDDVLDSHYSFLQSGLHTICLDEVQFMDTAETIDVVQTLLNNGINVIAAGLDQDSRGQPFETTGQLLALSDTVTKIRSVCAVCGKDATKTYRIDSSNTDRVAVGSVNMYEPRCLEHWRPQ